MTDQDVRALIAELGRKTAEIAEIQRQAEQEKRESRREIDLQLKETDRQIRTLGRQLGGLGEKFGGFTEGLALPSMRKILLERFRMEQVAPRVLARNNGHSMEVDALAHSESRNEAFVVEVKSHLREDGLDQIRRILRDFRTFFPQHADKKVFGILAAVDISDHVAAKVLKEGIYLARIHDGQFEIRVPDGFQPRAF